MICYVCQFPSIPSNNHSRIMSCGCTGKIWCVWVRKLPPVACGGSHHHPVLSRVVSSVSHTSSTSACQSANMRWGVWHRFLFVLCCEQTRRAHIASINILQIMCVYVFVCLCTLARIMAIITISRPILLRHHTARRIPVTYAPEESTERTDAMLS